MASSRVACASFNLGTNTTITITRDNKAYTHTLKYSFNGATGTIVTKTTQTTYVWTPPASVFYAKIPNMSSGYGTVTCETYNGNTLIGTTSAGFYVYTTKEACAPDVSGTVVDTNPKTIALTGNSSIMVCYLSKPKCTLTANAKNSATIKTIQIENPVGLVATTSPYTFDTVYSREFRFKATDSRGYSTITKVNAGGFIEYDPCYFEKVPVVTRSESTAETASTSISGYCFKGSFGSASNTLTVKYRYKTSNGTYGSYTTVPVTWNANGTFAANISITGLSLNETYTFEFVVEDKLTSFPVESVMGQSTGDVRIAKDYVQTKNNVYIGTEKNTEFRATKLRRVLNGHLYEANFGVGNAGGGGACAIELYEDGVQISRYDLHKDKFLYNTITNMSVAEISGAVPESISNGMQGHFVLNGGTTNPVLFQWGRITVTPDKADTLKVFPVGFFRGYTGIPFVCSDKATSAPDTVHSTVGDITSSGFNIYLKRPTATATSILWLAIGNGTASMPE